MSQESAIRFFPLSRIVDRIDQLLRPAMEKTFWIRAELSSAKTKGQNFFCDLVETNDRGQLLAQVRCTIWGTEMRRIRDKFESQGLDLNLSDGTVVGMLCRLQFHPVYGMALRGVDMDPAFALGELELKKRAILERLTKEGLDQNNKKLTVPTLPVIIGLITGEGTAAFYDFTKTLFSSEYGFSIRFASATMQGEKTERTILKALKALAQQKVDLVVISRGGGSKVDLSWLDNEKIARVIADYPHPVWTGIGHEIDVSVLDLVAGQSFKTPTAVAEDLISRYEGMDQYGKQARHNLKSAWDFRLRQEIEFVDHAKKGIVLGTQKLLDKKRSALRQSMESLNGRVQMRLSLVRQEWSQKQESLRERPKSILRQRIQGVKNRESQLQRVSQQILQRAQLSLAERKARFRITTVLTHLTQRRTLLDSQKVRLLRGPIWSRLSSEKEMNASRLKMLRASDPKRNLERGYAIVRKRGGKALSAIEDLSVGDSVEVSLGKGTVRASVDEVLS
jgi:exodeoxyribonuclease VII large subunit